ncbi:MAG: hypothetical protein LKI03_00030 [Acetobacter indonesiensis]|jgi:hypothetical protein|nr:hypothetical protein [Acetobacter indonesiensis]MCI1545335.1 hypothetical protein [Acetobacter indonesiensis]MCI1764421.1 hypothetical protein [Acetobacter indonesiensis]
MVFRIDDTTSVAAMPAPPTDNIGAPGFFTGGSTTGLSATRVRYWWLNMVQEELMAFAAAAGIPPNKTDTAQVLKAAQILFAPAQRGVAPYNAALATLIGGYPKFAVVVDASGAFWVSTADENMTVPSAEDANWASLFANYTSTDDGDYRYVRTDGAGDLLEGHKIYFGFNGTRMVGIVGTTEFGNIAFSNQFQAASSKIYYAASSAERSVTLNHTAPVPGTYIVQVGVNVGAPPGATQPYMAALDVFFNGAPNPVDSDSTPLSMSHALTIPAVAGENTISCVYQPASTSGTWYPIGLSLSYLFVPS